MSSCFTVMMPCRPLKMLCRSQMIPDSGSSAGQLMYNDCVPAVRYEDGVRHAVATGHLGPACARHR